MLGTGIITGDVLRRPVRVILGRARDRICLSGGAGGVRTRDLIDAIDARSQLRYGPTLVICAVNFIASWCESVKRCRRPICANLLDGLRPDISDAGTVRHGGSSTCRAPTEKIQRLRYLRVLYQV